VAEVYIHRDKIRCAIDLLEKGVSQREIAKTYGLSMSQVSAIGREYGYYINVKEYFERLKEEKKREYESWRKSVDEERRRLEAEFKVLGERLNALKDEERALQKSIDDLRRIEGSLKQEVAALEKALNIVCFHYLRHRIEAERRMESLEKAIGRDVWELLEGIRILVSPELFKDLGELEKAIDTTTMTKEHREYLKGKLRRLANALTHLMVLLGAREHLVSLATLASLRNLCSAIEELERARKREVE